MTTGAALAPLLVAAQTPEDYIERVLKRTGCFDGVHHGNLPSPIVLKRSIRVPSLDVTIKNVCFDCSELGGRPLFYMETLDLSLATANRREQTPS